MDSNNCTDVDDLMKRYYLPVAYGVIFVVGLVGNVTSIGVYLTKMWPWQTSSIIMVNLALTDLLYVLSMPFLIYYYSNGEMWNLGDFMCRFVRFGFHFNLYGSVLFLTCLAVFRFVVVAKPLWAPQVQQKRWGIGACAAVWVIAAAELTPMLTVISLKEQDNKTICLDFASTGNINVVWWYGWVLTALGFLLPLVVVFMCYIGIVRKLATGPRTSNPSRTRAQRVTVLILVVFVLCFLPYHILRVLRMETQMSLDTPCMVRRTVHTAYIVSRPLAAFNTFFNLALYTMSGDKFRQAFLSTCYLQCLLAKARSLLPIAVIGGGGTDAPAQWPADAHFITSL
ncbi:2-oxoglutarate receptor 1-like [Genypterus blacodes]|uniref:2-oxoglutarate receptor 1-like n=1 Tax=Genypterus blacodes TaxID=154954 RepID=UPI003F7666B5